MKRKRESKPSDVADCSDIRDWIGGDFKFKPIPYSVKKSIQPKMTDIYPHLMVRYKMKKSRVKKMRQGTLEEFCGKNGKDKIPVKINGRQLFFLPDKTGKAWFKVSSVKVTSVVTEGFLKDAGNCGWSVTQYADGLQLQNGEVKFIVYLNEKKDTALIELLQ